MRKFCVVSRWVAAGATVRHISWDPEIVAEHDSGFMFFSGDEPEDADDLDPSDLEPWCLHCLIDRHPEAGRGMDLARRYGYAVWNGDEWEAVPAE